LKPILSGAGILYVVDGAHPYGAEYEAEMEILRWTGQPRMALINLIGTGNHVDEWRRALNQYFSIVRVFDALRADFAKRIELLRAFRELSEVDQGWSLALDQAVRTLERDRHARRQRAASEIADMLSDVLPAQESAPAPEGFDEAHLSAALTERLRTRIRRREASSRRAIQDLYRHRGLQTQLQEVDVLQADLFSRRSFAVFGLSSMQLAMTGAATGALAGGVIDVAVGGASLLLGAGIGALLGGVGAALGSDRLARTRILGSPLGGHRLVVGPIAAVNLPWVLLGRAVLHHQLVAELNHAKREALVIDVDAGSHLTDRIDSARRRRLAATFARIREQRGLTPEQRDAFVADIIAAMDEFRTDGELPVQMRTGSGESK
jgi:hypothetical protein